MYIIIFLLVILLMQGLHKLYLLISISYLNNKRREKITFDVTFILFTIKDILILNDILLVYLNVKFKT